VLREKSLVVAFLIQLFLAGFSTLLLTGLTALYSPEAVEAAPSATVAYVGPGGFDGYLERAGNLEVEDVFLDEGLAGFRDGTYGAVVQESAPEGEVHTITVLLPDGELDTTLLVTQMKSLLLQFEQDLRQQRSGRLEQELYHLPQDVPSPGPYAFVYTTLLPLLVVTPVFLSGAIAGDALSQESRSRTLLLLRSAPVSPGTLVAGKLLVPVLLVPLQVALWLVLFALNGYPTEEPVLLLAVATLLGLLLCGAGLLVAAAVRNESATQAVYALVVLVLAGGSLLLPRDPLNLIALMAVGHVGPAAGASILILAASSVAVAALAAAWTRHRIRTDRL